MAKAIMVQGTASGAGKSLLVAGLCRIFKQDGYKTVPFKSQNMALNSFITADGLEMGRAQAMQAEACGVAPDVRMNPILLKPTNDMGSQVIVNGHVKGTMSAGQYASRKAEYLPDIKRAYQELARENNIIVIEGAGSPAEINMNDGDFVNMGMAEIANSPVIIVGDIDRGGVFASLAGTMLLLKASERAMVKGVVINKFRGDVDILAPGLRQLESVIKVPVLGVVPLMDIAIDDEDGLTQRFSTSVDASLVDIAVIKLPRISNFTDFNPLELLEGVSLRYVGSAMELGSPDLIILPGTKNTMSDLLWLRQSGLETMIIRHANGGKPVLGICGGFQMLGESISDPHNVEHGGVMSGIGLLPITTTFAAEKTRKQCNGRLSQVSGMFSNLSGLEYVGYEIHMGISEIEENIVNEGNVYGTYIHGLFDMEGISQALAAKLFESKGLDFSSIAAFDMSAYKQQQYDKLANNLRDSLEMSRIYDILSTGITF